MRLWDQRVTREGSFAAYRAALGWHLAAAAGPGVEIAGYRKAYGRRVYPGVDDGG